MRFIGLFRTTFCVQVSIRNVFFVRVFIEKTPKLILFSDSEHTFLPFSNILYYYTIIMNQVRVTTAAFRVNFN